MQPKADHTTTGTKEDMHPCPPGAVTGADPMFIPFEAPKNPSRMELGKMRRAYITETFGKVIACGHKFHPRNPPGGNCEHCWFAFFHLHPDMTKSCAAVCADPQMGEKILEAAQGTKFVKQFRKFILHQMSQETK